MKQQYNELRYKKKKAKESEEKLEEEIRKVMESDKQQGANIDEMVVYNRSDNVKVLLDMESDSWKARIIINNEIADIFMRNELFDEKLKKVLENSGYTNESTIFCDFIYDGSKPGTYSAYKNIKRGLESLANSYKNIYISETDLSIGE